MSSGIAAGALRGTSATALLRPSATARSGAVSGRVLNRSANGGTAPQRSGQVPAGTSGIAAGGTDGAAGAGPATTAYLLLTADCTRNRLAGERPKVQLY